MLGESGWGSFDCNNPMLAPGRCGVELWEAAGHHSWGGGAQSEVPRPAMRPELSGSQALGHPGAAGSCGKDENKVGARRLNLTWEQGGKEGSCGWVPWGGESLVCWQAGGRFGLVVVSGSTEIPCTRD